MKEQKSREELMEEIAKYPVGIQTFQEVIKGGWRYVDKTAYVHKLLTCGKYFFLSRPRRFGKSLFVSTLEAYFLGQRELFKGLALDGLTEEWTEHPVFHIDFTGEPYESRKIIRETLDETFLEWEKLYGETPRTLGYGKRLARLLKAAYEKTGQKAVVLVDEYDKPLTDAIGMSAIQNYNRKILQGLYSVLKKEDKNIFFAFLTGVTRYGKLGIFSANNNPKDISLAREFSAICGITEEELRVTFEAGVTLLADYLKVSMDEAYYRLKKKYDGYHFGADCEGVYNPFSLLNALSFSSLENYWFRTGTPTYLVEMLKKNGFDVTELENGIEADEESISYFGDGETNVKAALYQAGYLTIKERKGDDMYVLAWPNEEVSKSLFRYLLPAYAERPVDMLRPLVAKLGEYAEKGQADSMMKQIRFIMAGLPFHCNDQIMLEMHYRNVIYLLFKFFNFRTQVELETAEGRLDICVETEKYVYVIECKRDLPAEKALEQIDLKRYAQGFMGDGKKVFRIGASFGSKERNLAEWAIGDD